MLPVTCPVCATVGYLPAWAVEYGLSHGGTVVACDGCGARLEIGVTLPDRQLFAVGVPDAGTMQIQP